MHALALEQDRNVTTPTHIYAHVCPVLLTHLCPVGEVSELCLPEHQRVGVLHGVTQLEAKHAKLGQGAAGGEMREVRGGKEGRYGVGRAEGEVEERERRGRRRMDEARRGE